MHWGHAVSEDLVHWDHLPIGLYPDSLGHIFSGSAVVDWFNTSGFGENGQPPLIAIFTYHDMEGEKAGRIDYQYQGIAYSNDRGRTWTKYADNPVIPNPGIKDFRDPKVIWDEASDQWIMVFAAWDQVKFYGSPNLKDWTHLSDFGKEWGSHGGVWECPDLFPIKVEETGENKWVLLLSINPGGPNGGSATQYFVGNFDGKNFTLEEDFAKALRPKESAIWLDYGRDNYAGVTWSDIPREDGRRIFMGWMSNWDYAEVVPTTLWRSAMTIARDINLHQTENGLRLRAQAVEEMQKIRGQEYQLNQGELSGSLDITGELGFSSSTMEVILEIELPENGQVNFGLELSNSQNERYRLGFDQANNQFYSDRRKSGKINFSEKFAAKIHAAPRTTTSNVIDMILYFDVASAELFADSGATALTDIFFPSSDYHQIRLYAENGSIKIKRAKLIELNSIW